MENNGQKFYVYTCFDPMVWPAVQQRYGEMFGSPNIFFDTDPGAARNIVMPLRPGDRDYVVWKIKLAHQVVPLTRIILINHSCCAAYRIAGITFCDEKAEEDFHREQLEKAAQFIREQTGTDVEIHYFLKDQQKFAW